MTPYPIVVIQDRYAGTYSGGQWLAIGNAYDNGDRLYRIVEFFESPYMQGGDIDATLYWEKPPAWIGVGQTPEDAIKALKAKFDSLTLRESA